MSVQRHFKLFWLFLPQVCYDLRLAVVNGDFFPVLRGIPAAMPVGMFCVVDITLSVFLEADEADIVEEEFDWRKAV